MKKDIPDLKVEDVAIAIVHEKDSEDNLVWNVYVVNLKDQPLEAVLVNSNGYGEVNGEPRKTSTLRHFLDTVPSKSFVKVEPIMEELFGINNEYWLSFFLDGQLYDKQYVFLAESIKEQNFTTIPLMNKKGVMIL
jgi:hypothetical protein